MPRRVVLTTQDLLTRLKSVEQELEQMAPAPRVELDREAILAMVRLSCECIERLIRVH